MNYEIQLNPDFDNVDWIRISELFEMVNWGYRDPAIVRTAFGKSSYCVFIYEGGHLIGFGRTMDDGRFYALLVDVVVNPAHQGKGIGTMIVTKLKEQLTGYSFVTLTAAPGKAGFYEKLGWKKQISSFIWPVSEIQEAEHCERKA
jgi:GNAT superfamily N-acetyltransferase